MVRSRENSKEPIDSNPFLFQTSKQRINVRKKSRVTSSTVTSGDIGEVGSTAETRGEVGERRGRPRKRVAEDTDEVRTTRYGNRVTSATGRGREK